MATATRVEELQALSLSVSHRGDDLVLHYDPQINHSPVSGKLVGDLPERVLCPVRAVRYLR